MIDMENNHNYQVICPDVLEDLVDQLMRKAVKYREDNKDEEFSETYEEKFIAEAPDMDSMVYRMNTYFDRNRQGVTAYLSDNELFVVLNERLVKAADKYREGGK
jgi:hypothetical protein